MKTKYSNIIDVEPNIKIQLLLIKPNIKYICNNKKTFHPSH